MKNSRDDGLLQL